jgi:hypothetical protein
MSTILHFLPGIACGALMCVPMTIGMARSWLRRRRRTPDSPTTPTPKALAALLRR